MATATGGADAFLCLSEHEGFCIPLLEAFHFGVPVIARDAGAVAEVVGDAGVLLDGDDGLATVAELLRIVVADCRAARRARRAGGATAGRVRPRPDGGGGPRDADRAGGA